MSDVYGNCTLTKDQKSAPMFTVGSSTASLTVSGISFNGGGTNMQTPANGGIFSIQGENAVFEDCTFTNCYVKDNQSSTPNNNGAKARSNGAAIAHYSDSNALGTLTIRNCRFDSCDTQSNNSRDVGNQALGGAVFFRRVNNSSRLWIEGTSFTGGCGVYPGCQRQGSDETMHVYKMYGGEAQRRCGIQRNVDCSEY